MKILVGGEFAPESRIYLPKICNGSGFKIFEKIKYCFRDSDYSILNLEAVVADKTWPIINKIGGTVETKAESIACLHEIGVKAVSLANNHIYDYGDKGLSNTINVLKQWNIEHVGAALKYADAKKSLIKKIGDLKIGFISACENEFSIAEPSHGGANEASLMNMFYQICDLRDKCDYIILLHHGGKEHYNLPTPKLQDKFRYFIDCGADVVINHHQHCFSGYETYKDKPIIYGTGNFCMDSGVKEPVGWNYGYLVDLELDNRIKFKIIPFFQDFLNGEIVPLEGSRQKKFYEEIEKLNKIISDREKLEEKFSELVNSNYNSTSISQLPSKILKSFAYRGLFPSLVTKSYKKMLAHQIRCETHREVLEKFLNS